MPRNICIQPCPPTSSFSVSIPFMGSMTASAALTLQGGCSGCELVSNFMLQITPTLSALGVPLCILGCIASIIGALQAVPDIVGPPPNPSGLITAIINVEKKCACVLEFALPPPVGAVCEFLKMIQGILTAIDKAITCVIGLLTHLITLNAKAQILLLSPVPAQRIAGNCLNKQVQAMMDDLNNKFGTINGLISLLSPVVSLDRKSVV